MCRCGIKASSEVAKQRGVDVRGIREIQQRKIREAMEGEWGRWAGISSVVQAGMEACAGGKGYDASVEAHDVRGCKEVFSLHT